MLTEGGVQVYAICKRCAARGGHSLRPGWLGVGGMLALVLLALVGLNVLVSLLSHR